jgi:hypothetical protein
MTKEKIRENRLRRMAKRQGLELHKSRRQDPRALDYGRYWLTLGEGARPADVPRDRRDLVGAPLTGHSLNEIEEMLTRGGDDV